MCAIEKDDHHLRSPLWLFCLLCVPFVSFQNHLNGSDEPVWTLFSKLSELPTHLSLGISPGCGSHPQLRNHQVQPCLVLSIGSLWLAENELDLNPDLKVAGLINLISSKWRAPDCLTSHEEPDHLNPCLSQSMQGSITSCSITSWRLSIINDERKCYKSLE